MKITSFACLLALTVVCNAAIKKGKWFDRIMIIQFENHSEDEVLADPNFAKFAKMGRAMLNYFAVTHPSQPNYWSQVAGDYFGINDDGVHDLPHSNVFDLFEEHGVTYKTYQQAYPGNCNPAEKIGTYYRKHNPLISFDSVRTNKTRCAKIVNSDEFDKDLKAKNLPNWFYYTPDINNDGHNTNVSYAGKWLDSFLTPRLSEFEKGTLIVITWDEDDYSEHNKILTSLLDPHSAIFKAGSKDETHYTHYSLLATIEQNWGIGNLGRNDKDANTFNWD